MNLVEAQADRHTRAAELADRQLDDLLDAVGLSEDEIKLGAADVSPQARKKLKGIIDALRRDPHPFTKCMKNLREEQPTWSDARRKKTCAVLKQLTGRSNQKMAASYPAPLLGEDACAMLDTDVVTLLDMVDMEVLADLEPVDGEQLAVVTAAKRKKMPKTAFVFPAKKGYPIHDRAHAANALARAKGKPEEAKVKAEVCKRFSDLPACQSGGK